MTQKILEQIEKYNQMHIFNFVNELSENEKTNLIEQVKNIDYSKIVKINNYNKIDDNEISPISILEVETIQKNQNRFEEIGIENLKKGKIGLVLLAGGQGSRLGFNKSKGMFNIGINKNLFLFQILIDNTKKIVDLVDNWLYIFIMTSPQNNNEIVNFFEENNYFNYNKEYIKFYTQNSLPSIDFNGKLLMKSKSELCFSPDGNGNFFNTLKRTYLWNIIKDNEIEWLNVFSIDNVLQKIADPIFIGATIESQCNCGTKVVKKRYAAEKMGAICLKNKMPSVIEYYELFTNHNKISETNSSYDYGVILNYLFKVEELEKINSDMLPIHYAEKYIKCIDENGKICSDNQINGYKLEYLITDLIQLLKTCLPFEVIREHEFAPIKNKTGVDSVESAREMLLQNGYDL